MRERRQFTRVPIKLNCHLDLSTGLAVDGHTKNISREGIFMILDGAGQAEDQARPKLYDVGELTLHYKKREVPATIKVRCRIVHLTEKGVGILTFYSELSVEEQKVVNGILGTMPDDS